MACTKKRKRMKNCSDHYVQPVLFACRSIQIARFCVHAITRFASFAFASGSTLHRIVLFVNKAYNARQNVNDDAKTYQEYILADKEKHDPPLEPTPLTAEERFLSRRAVVYRSLLHVISYPEAMPRFTAISCLAPEHIPRVTSISIFSRLPHWPHTRLFPLYTVNYRRSSVIYTILSSRHISSTFY